MLRFPSCLCALACAVVLASAYPSAADAQRRGQLITELDDERAGQEGARAVAAQVGIFDDRELNAYVQGIGLKLLRGLPRRAFRYQFFVVDQAEPNAFALPGGFIFISRGLLALVESEDELANVIGHEITHSAKRHAMRQQAIAAHQSPLVMGLRRTARLRGYNRDMEREADRLGQQLAAAAGYDPRGMATFMERLGDWGRLSTGMRREPSFFDTHPTTSERAVVNSVRASEMRWKRDKTLGDTHSSYLERLDGLPLGMRPEAGVFRGTRFLHPDLDFQVRFPNGWQTSNTNIAVGAQAPRGAAVVFLTADAPPGKPKVSADKFLSKNQDLRVKESRPVKIVGRDAWRVLAQASAPNGRSKVYFTFLQHQGSTWRFTGVVPSSGARRYEDNIINTMRSFRPLTPDQKRSIRGTRLRIVKAEPGDDLSKLSERYGNVWDRSRTAVANGVNREHRFDGGELVKVARSEAYVSSTR